MFQSLHFIIPLLYSAQKIVFGNWMEKSHLFSPSFNLPVLISFVYKDVILKGSHLNSFFRLVWSDYLLYLPEQGCTATPVSRWPRTICRMSVKQVRQRLHRMLAAAGFLRQEARGSARRACSDCPRRRARSGGQGAAFLCILQFWTTWSTEVMN